MRYLGLCGIDNATKIQDLIDLSKVCPKIEWGILFNSRLAGNKRYPTVEWVEDACLTFQQHNMNVAGHFCDSKAIELLQGEVCCLNYVVEVLGVQRIQINPTRANGVNLEDYPEAALRLSAVFGIFYDTEFLLQRNDETEELCRMLEKADIENLSFLLDASCGLGIYSDDFITSVPLCDNPCGFAGGFGPDNLAEVLGKIKSAELPESTWVDMESKIRTEDLLDIDKCKACANIFLREF